MSSFLLLRPAWLLALIPVLALAVFALRRNRRGAWTAVTDPALIPVLLHLGWLRNSAGTRVMLLPFIAAGATALALSGPAVPQAGRTELRALDPLVLMLDLSPSVVSEARSLSDLQAAAAGLITAAAGRPVGMMLYTADAWLASAPTTDSDTLLSLIGVLDRETAPIAGSRPDIALAMARDLFSTADGEGHSLPGGVDLVLVTDGGGSGPRATEEAARLAHDGARVWGLALTPAAAAPAQDAAGLAAIARAGGGESYAFADISGLSAAITRARSAKLAREDVAGAGMRDLGPWLLVLALACLFPLFLRWR